MSTKSFAAAAAVMLTALAPTHAAAIDWDRAAAHEVLLFQPGQSAWEWLVVPARHDGARRMREGRNCLYCHEGEERVIGAAIGSGERLEPAPMPGMPHVVELALSAAIDDGHLYVRLSFPALRRDAPAGDAEIHTRATVVLGSDALPPAAIAGCWISCHSDLPGMPDAGAGNTRTKYLPNSRARMTSSGGGDVLRSDEELAAERAAGRILEYMQVHLHRDRLHKAVDGYFLDARHEYEDSRVEATATLADNRWTVVMHRALAADGRLALEAGKQYPLNIALHDNHADGRHHFVSFPLILALDDAGTGVVVKSQ